MIEPSTAERGAWPDATADYVAELERGMAALRTVLTEAAGAGLVVSGPAAPEACLEYRAFRAAWLTALPFVGLTEAEAFQIGAGAYARAPQEPA